MYLKPTLLLDGVRIMLNVLQHERAILAIVYMQYYEAHFPEQSQAIHVYMFSQN